MAVQAEHLDQADRIRENHERRNASIRARTELTDQAKAALLARSYTDAQSHMTELQRSATADTADRRARAERSAFGTADLPGDAATLAISLRDAQDRSATLTSPTDAAALLARAERSGDELLARAVAGHAHDQAGSALGGLDPSWSNLVAAYTASRPAAARHVATLRDLQPSTEGSLRSTFAYVVPRPAELSNTPASQLDALATAAP